MKSTFTERYDRFRNMFVERRKSAGLTQTAVAERLGKPQSFVSKAESGERRVDLIEFLDFASAIGFDPVQFLKELEGTAERKEHG